MTTALTECPCRDLDPRRAAAASASCQSGHNDATTPPEAQDPQTVETTVLMTSGRFLTSVHQVESLCWCCSAGVQHVNLQLKLRFNKLRFSLGLMKRGQHPPTEHTATGFFCRNNIIISTRVTRQNNRSSSKDSLSQRFEHAAMAAGML